MNGSQRKAAQRKARAEESRQYAEDMSRFVNGELGSLLVAEDEGLSDPSSGDDGPGAATRVHAAHVVGEVIDASSVTLLEPAIPPSTAIVPFPVTRQQIETRRKEFGAIEFSTKDGYETGRQALAFCRNTRKAVNDRKKQIKDPHFAFLNSVEREAEAILAMIDSFEAPLQLKKDAQDAKKAEERAAEERRKQEEIVTKLRAEREAEDAERRAAHQAQQAQLAAERAELDRQQAALAAEREQQERARAAQEAENKRIQAEADRAREERAKLEAEIAEQRRAIEAERLQLEQQKAAAVRAEQDRLAKIEEDRLAAERAEQDRLDAAARAERERVEPAERAERERVESEARAAAEMARLEAMRPDIEKVHSFAKELRSIKEPEVISLEASTAITIAMAALNSAATELERFGSEVAAAAE